MAGFGDMVIWASPAAAALLLNQTTVPENRNETRKIRFPIANFTQTVAELRKTYGIIDVGYDLNMRSKLRVQISFLKENEENPKTFLQIFCGIQSTETTTKNPLTGTFNPMILRTNGNLFYSKEDDSIVNFTNLERRMFGFKKFINVQHIMSNRGSLLKNDTLIIEAHFQFFGKPNSSPIPMDGSKFKRLLNGFKLTTGNSGLGHDFFNLLQDGEFSDITLDVQGQVFKAHKCILSARSPVFKAMFKSGMVESSTGTVQIDDIKPEVMMIVIIFIYSGKFPKLETWKNSIPNILYACEKYNLVELSRHLDATIKRKVLTRENLVEFNRLAEIYGLYKTGKKIEKMQR